MCEGEGGCTVDPLPDPIHLRRSSQGQNEVSSDCQTSDSPTPGSRAGIGCRAASFCFAWPSPSRVGGGFADLPAYCVITSLSGQARILIASLSVPFATLGTKYECLCNVNGNGNGCTQYIRKVCGFGLLLLTLLLLFNLFFARSEFGLAGATGLSPINQGVSPSLENRRSCQHYGVPG